MEKITLPAFVLISGDGHYIMTESTGEVCIWHTFSNAHNVAEYRNEVLHESSDVGELEEILSGETYIWMDGLDPEETVNIYN